MKKIFIISMEFPPFPGGIGNQAYNLAYEFSKIGHKVDVLTEYRSKDSIKVENEFDAKQLFAIKRIKRYDLIIITYAQRILQSFKSVLTHKYDAVFCSAKFPIWIGALLSIVISKKKLFSIVHGSEILAGSEIVRFITKSSLKRYKTIVAVSTYTKNLLLKQCIYDNIVVIPNGFQVLNLNAKVETKLEGKPVLITVGNVTRRKGQQNVIKALPTIISFFPDAHYHIVGIPTCKEEFLILAKNLGVDKHITFHGIVSSDELPVLLSQSDIFLMLSEMQPDGDVEGFGIAILEANSLGIPAVGSINSGISDAIKDNFSGILVDPHNSNEILNAIEKILSRQSEFKSQAHEWSKNFTWNKIIKQYVKILDT